MAGCGRRPKMDKESDGQSGEMPAAHKGPESSDDRSAAPHEENQEHSLKNIHVRKKNIFTEAQLNTLEALFKNRLYLTPTELERLANQLSLPQKSIQRWFQNRRTKLKNQKKLAHQRPEGSDDRSAAPHDENPEHSPNKIQLRKKNVFTKAQRNTLEAFFKKKQYVTPTEREQLANHLSVRQQIIQSWFKHRREKLKHQALNPKKTPVQDQAANSKTPTKAHQDLQHKQKIEPTLKCVQTQKQPHLDSFPPQQPMDSYALPQGLHSSGMVDCQNVGGPSDSCSGTEVCKMLPESGHKPPSAFHFNLCLPNKTPNPGTSIWTPVPSVTTDRTSYDGPSTSSGPSTSRMPIAPDNADEGSSTNSSLVIDVEATDSD